MANTKPFVSIAPQYVQAGQLMQGSSYDLHTISISAPLTIFATGFNPILPSGEKLDPLEEIRLQAQHGAYGKAISLLLDELEKRQKALDNLTQVLGLKDDE